MNKRESTLFRWLTSAKVCPYFNDPPVGDDDLELITSHWVFCGYEDRCLEKDQCPLIPDVSIFPRIIGGK